MHYSCLISNNGKNMPGKKLKFPDPRDYAAKDPVVLCPADLVIGLYNQETNSDAKRIAKNLKTWFENEAVSRGWAACKFVPEVQSKHGAGCMLLNPLSVTVTVNKIEIRLGPTS